MFLALDPLPFAFVTVTKGEGDGALHFALGRAHVERQVGICDSLLGSRHEPRNERVSRTLQGCTMHRLQLLFIVMAALLWVNPAQAGESWYLDPYRYHVSAHGQNSCLDCHENVAEETLHPDPSNVNRSEPGSFDARQCISCHDDILDNLDQGRHGSQKVDDRSLYRDCTRCHEPHYQLGLGETPIDTTVPIREQCGACHEKHEALPPLAEEDEACMACHRLPEPGRQEDRERIERLCFHCHGNDESHAQQITSERVPPIDEEAYRQTAHAAISCMTCHPQAAQYGHDKQGLGDCHRCHQYHDEKVAHDAHRSVSCEACHLTGVRPVRDTESGRVLWERVDTGNHTSDVHDMLRQGDSTTCLRCHVRGNQVGAVAMILPPKSVICMPCHAATFSIADVTTISALIIFLAGIVFLLAYVLSGSMPGVERRGPLVKLFAALWSSIKTVCSPRIFPMLRAVVLEGLLQRRLFRQSRSRWLIHGLIFWPFVFRFSWGIVALVGSIWMPERSFVWPMLDKNDAATALLFDLSGMMLMLGLLLAFVRGRIAQSSRLPDQPRQDQLALGLIAAIVVIGFVLEGMRIAMTGRPEGSVYAVVGYAISTLFSSPNELTDIYGIIWYIHALLTGAFVAYLPFSRLLHIILAPIVLAMSGAMEHKHDRM